MRRLTLYRGHVHGPPEDFEPRTDAEGRFLEVLLPLVPDLDIWDRYDRNGRPWLLVSLDIVSDGWIKAVPRIDFDGRAITGGYSPAMLNWDAESTAAECGIDPQGPGGIHLTGSPAELAEAAAGWFRGRLDRWKDEQPVMHRPGDIPRR